MRQWWWSVIVGLAMAGGGCTSVPYGGDRADRPYVVLAGVDLATAKRIVMAAMEQHGWKSLGGNLYTAKFTGGSVGRISLTNPRPPDFRFRKPPHILFKLKKVDRDVRVSVSYQEENRDLTDGYRSDLERLLEMISREKEQGAKLRLDRFPLEGRFPERLDGETSP